MAAMEINRRFDDGQPVHWQQLMPIPMPTGVQLTMQDPAAIEAQKGESENDG